MPENGSQDPPEKPSGTEARSGEVTRILRSGDPKGQDNVLPLVYEELRMIARRRMSQERANHTLQATALVHEAYERLLGAQKTDWQDRRHFYAAAAEAMRRVLIDHARMVGAQKRGGDRQRVALGTEDTPVEMEVERVLALNDALTILEKEDSVAAEVVRLRFLAGLNVDEVAHALEMSERTVARHWAFARARLFEILAEDDD